MTLWVREVWAICEALRSWYLHHSLGSWCLDDVLIISYVKFKWLVEFVTFTCLPIGAHEIWTMCWASSSCVHSQLMRSGRVRDIHSSKYHELQLRSFVNITTQRRMFRPIEFVTCTWLSHSKALRHIDESLQLRSFVNITTQWVMKLLFSEKDGKSAQN